MSDTTTTYVILAQSARSSRACLIGEGTTESAAWLDAYGPKPWSPYTKKCARNAWARAVDSEELRDLHLAAAMDA